MIPRVLFASLLLMSPCFSEEAEPSELTQLRGNWKKASKQSLDQLNKKYLDALIALKAKLAKEGKLAPVIAVDTEIKIAKETNFKHGIMPLYCMPIVRVISANYGTSDKRVDVTAKVKELIEVKRKMFSCSPGDLGSDPSPGWKKTLTVIYTVDGTLRQQTRNEDENILMDSFYH